MSSMDSDSRPPHWTHDAEAGLVSAGMFVAPDAVQCAIGNPAWMYPTLGTITAIGDIAWSEDSMRAREPTAPRVTWRAR